MSQLYRNVFHRPVEDIAPGDEGELDLSVEQEAEYLRQGRLEIMPRPYRVSGPRRVADTDPGEVFLAAYRIEQEALLIDSGHIERAPRTAERRKEAAKVAKAEADKES